ncbi:sugar ABC transporter permease [Clostridia bacterium]|nr:sugar ABC transporter permease [Clostridia bacterium]
MDTAIKYNKKHISAKNRLITAVLYLTLTAVAVFLIFPYVFMVSRSLMTVADYSQVPVNFFPAKPSLEAYKNIFVDSHYFKYMLNTLIIVAVNLIAVPLSASLCAYGFTKIKYPGSNFVFSLVLATMMIPGALLQIPLFVFFSKLGWLGTLLPFTLPSFLGGGALYIFLLMQFMRGIPNELENAARIDGAGVLTRYARITMPLCIPVVLFIMVSVFGGLWSDFYGPLIYLKTNPASYTLALKIYIDTISVNVSSALANVRMAAGVFMSIPPAVLFLLYQRKLVDGVMVGAIKG